MVRTAWKERSKTIFTNDMILYIKMIRNLKKTKTNKT